MNCSMLTHFHNPKTYFDFEIIWRYARDNLKVYEYNLTLFMILSPLIIQGCTSASKKQRVSSRPFTFSEARQ